MTLVDDDRREYTKQSSFELKKVFNVVEVADAHNFVLIHENNIDLDAVRKASHHNFYDINVLHYEGERNSEAFTAYVIEQINLRLYRIY